MPPQLKALLIEPGRAVTAILDSPVKDDDSITFWWNKPRVVADPTRAFVMHAEAADGLEALVADIERMLEPVVKGLK